MHKLPNIYHLDSDKIINNNQEYSYASENKIIEKQNNIKDIIEKIYEEPGFIFNKPLIITTNTNKYETAIIKVSNNLIYTLTDDIINIDDITSIERHN